MTITMNRTSKQCSKCGVEKPLSEFYLRDGSTDRYWNYCKQCVSVKGRERRRRKRTIDFTECDAHS